MNPYDVYYAALQQLDTHGAHNELQRRRAFSSLLTATSGKINWTLVEEVPLPGGRRPDGTLYDRNRYPCGYWEAKDTGDDLDKEIKAKIAAGYPLKNTIFEDSRRGVLYQDQKPVFDADLTQQSHLKELLRRFYDHREQVREEFEAAVGEFQERIPELAAGIEKLIEEEKTRNAAFRQAFAAFHDLCRTALNPQITAVAVEEMLVQHLLTERVFRTVFENTDFTRRNVIAAEIEKVIDALVSRAFNRLEYLRKLDFFYLAIERTAHAIHDFSEKQGFLNLVYERFFQGFSKDQADTHGIVYTPQPIVDFMCASVDYVLREQFGVTLSSPGVRILDPCTGTGNFIVNLINRIDPQDLPRKYRDELFANEVMLLPYYIAALNIEHAYYKRTGTYEPFEGICFADTLDMAEGPMGSLFTEANTERVQREKDAEITVIIGNPPYNVGQQNENDNNKNRKYPVVDQRIRDTYAKESRATNKNALSDAYVRFFRWATDRLAERDGVVCFVSNNSFLNQIAFDGMRKQLAAEFTGIYHLDRGGNVRRNPKLSGTTHNVFGIQVGVGITVLVRRRLGQPEGQLAHIRHWAQTVDARASERLGELASLGAVGGVAWVALAPDDRGNWITEGMRTEFGVLAPLGEKASPPARDSAGSIFHLHGGGVKTNRDDWAYDFGRDKLVAKVTRFAQTYNGEVDRWGRRTDSISVDEFVNYSDSLIKWSRDLKADLMRGRPITYSERNVRNALYRPYCHRFLFLDRIVDEEVYRMPGFYPNPASEGDSLALCMTDIASEKPFMLLATDRAADFHLVGAGAGTQCFPFYVYDEDGTNRRENITDWALKQFQEAVGAQVTKWDIFHYVYALLHHPAYRERYAENLKKELPRIPVFRCSGTPPTPASLAGTLDQWNLLVETGRKLAELHVGYEAVEEWPLTWRWKAGVPYSWHVEKMRLTREKDAVIVNDTLTLGDVPPEALQYRLGNRSALEWVVDQYRVTKDKRSGIESDPNRPDDEQYIARLVGRVVNVSVQTVRLVRAMAEAVPWPEAPS